MIVKDVRDVKENKLLVLILVVVTTGAGIFIVVTFAIDGGNLKRVRRNDLEIGAAFIALNDLAFFDIVHIDDERVVAFGANNRHWGELLLPGNGG